MYVIACILSKLFIHAFSYRYVAHNHINKQIPSETSHRRKNTSKTCSPQPISILVLAENEGRYAQFLGVIVQGFLQLMESNP